jgi:purine-nucleoside phosphorylase
MTAVAPLKDLIAEALAAVRARTRLNPGVGIILGTGLGGLAARIKVECEIPYETIPHFPVSTVESHAGRLLVGTLGGHTVVAMQGRFHRYEGYDLRQVTFPVRVMRAMGVEHPAHLQCLRWDASALGRQATWCCWRIISTC